MLYQGLLKFGQFGLSNLSLNLVNKHNIVSVTVKKMSTGDYNKNCIFCKIIRDEVPAEKIYQDDDVICIKDIKPASTHHYLIIPKNHVQNAKYLKAEDEQIFNKVVSMVDVISQQQNLDVNSIRTGFHWPPFTTVEHLHLHVISPVENMGFIQNIMFKPNSYWFVSIDYVKSRFKDNIAN